MRAYCDDIHFSESGFLCNVTAQFSSYGAWHHNLTEDVAWESQLVDGFPVPVPGAGIQQF